MQDLHRQSSYFQVLMRFLKRARREAASGISIGTCCQSWLAQYGIASSPYFSELGFSVWKMCKFQRLYIFSLTGCPHIYHDEKSRQYQEYQEGFSGNIKTFNWNYFINSLGKHTLASYQYDFLHQSQYFVIVCCRNKIDIENKKT